MEDTINAVLNVFTPPPADIIAEPTVSPTFIDEIAKEPPSDTNDDVNISGSFGSWLTLIVKSVKLSQSVFESETETVGEKGIRDWAIIAVGFNKKPKQNINVNFNKLWVKFLFIILFFNTCF